MVNSYVNNELVFHDTIFEDLWALVIFLGFLFVVNDLFSICVTSLMKH